MENEVLILNDQGYMGRIINVDTTRAIIYIDNHNIINRLSVTDLVAIKTFSEQKILIGMVESVSRGIEQDDVVIDGMELDVEYVDNAKDLVKVAVIGTFFLVKGDEKNIFKRGASSFPLIDSKCYLIESNNLQRFMGIFANGDNDEYTLDIGTFVNDSNAKAILDGDKLFQRHACILGSTGSGKSWCVATILEKAAKLKYSNIIVFDIHGEYKTLTIGDDKIAEGYHIAGACDSEENEEAIYMPYWLLNREELLSMVLDRSDNNAPNQASRFTLHIKDLKKDVLEKEDKHDLKKSFTVDSPIPYSIEALMELLKEDDTRKGIGAKGAPVKGEWEGKLTRFVSRLEAKIDDKRYSFMYNPPKQALEYNWLYEMVGKLLESNGAKKGIKIVDFSEVPSDVLPIVTGTLARILYNVQFWLNEEERTPFTILCDEAHLYLPLKENVDSVERQALYNFERIAKEGRKYGVSLLVVSQRPSDVSKTILSQCNNFIILRLTNDRDQSVVKNLIPDSLKGVVECLPILDVGESIVLGDSILLPNRIRINEPLIKPKSDTKKFWTEWNEKMQEKDKLITAIENFRAQTRL
ncbi:MAG: ATP-binding protein [Clostridium butyricum]|uniref:ATP-binding protein n=1 Tax=Clostridium sp. TaxID=1506 RepID=UPI0029014A1B|nr:ATP-binding protein [Clostridium sp.]MDU1116021.1 ATP-binding protein [Clostridium sp.]MDU7712372.1 ATP-binding protein [Clostridium butyricum]